VFLASPGPGKEHKVAKTQSNSLLNSLLNLLGNPIHRRRQQSRVPGQNGYRIIGEMVDETGIGSNNETDNIIINDIHILDCGHTSQNNLGGRCHYCDICPQDTVIANFDEQNKPYCRACAEEIKRSLKLRAIGKTVFSIFVSDDNAK
jgi:hypothetical protein